MGLTVEQPSGIFFASDDMCFTYGLDAISDANTLRKLLFRIKATTDDQLHREYISYEPKATEEKIPVNFRKLISQHLGTAIPKLDQTTNTIIDTSFIQSYVSEHGTKEINLETREVIDNTELGEPFTVVNAHIQPYQDNTKSDVMILTDKKRVALSIDTHDWIRVFGAATATITYFYKDGTSTSQTLTVATALWPCGPAQLARAKAISDNRPLSHMRSYKIVFTAGGQELHTVNYTLIDDCTSSEKRIDVYFLEPKGSWSAMCFYIDHDEQINKTLDVLCRSGACPTSIEDLFAKYGRNIINRRSWMSASLSKRFVSYAENIEYHRAFANARQYRAAFPFAEGNRAQLLAPFVPTTTQINTHSRKQFQDLSFNGYYGLDLNS